MNTPRNGYTRGQSPKRPGDLTGRILVANQAHSEAERRVMNSPSVDVDAIRTAEYKRGYDTGYSDGIRFVQETYDVFIKEDEDLDAELERP